jgi:hypothetical protein
MDAMEKPRFLEGKTVALLAMGLCILSYSTSVTAQKVNSNLVPIPGCKLTKEDKDNLRRIDGEITKICSFTITMVKLLECNSKILEFNREYYKACKGKCRIEVQATPIPIGIGWHLAILYTDESKDKYIFRGQPGNHTCPGHEDDLDGTLDGFGSRYYGPSSVTHGEASVDWAEDPPSVIVAAGREACGKNACFSNMLIATRQSCIPYHVLGPNSNTVVRAMLQACGLPVLKPEVFTPGWEMPLIETDSK